MNGRGRSLGLGIAIALLGAVVPLAGAAAPAPDPLEGLPRYDHVFILIEENESIDATYGPSSPATYLKSLAHQGAFADHYYGIGHASLDNYIAMLNGQPDLPQTGADCAGLNLFQCAQPQQAFAGGRNLADQLDSVGVTWKGYMDGTTGPCQHASYDPTAAADSWQGNGSTPAPARKDYADRHNPFLYFPDIVGSDARCQAHVLPYTQLGADLTSGNVPQFGFITPDTCHDGHDTPCWGGGGPGGLVSTDAWLQQNIPALLSYLNAHKGLLLITTDEGQTQDISGCCTGGPAGQAGFGGRVGLVALGPRVKAGQTVTTPYDHVSMLRTVEDLFGISEHLNNAGTATPMKDLFSTAPTVSQQSQSGPAEAVMPPAGAVESAQGTLPFTSAGGSRAPAGPIALLVSTALAAVLLYRGRSGPKRRRSE
jgi:phospholipase C